MTRAVLEEVLLFLIPFALYAVWLMARRKTPLERAHWDPHMAWLVIAGLVVASGWLLWTGITADRHIGGYVPAHMENGRLVPGKVE